MTDMEQRESSGWRPEPGDSVTGKLVSLDNGWSDWASSYYPILTLQPTIGAAVQIHCFHATLLRRLADIRPQIGDTLTIRYEGKKPSKDGKRTIAIYAVGSDRSQDAGAFWDRVPQPRSTPASQHTVQPSRGNADDDDDIPF